MWLSVVRRWLWLGLWRSSSVYRFVLLHANADADVQSSSRGIVLSRCSRLRPRLRLLPVRSRPRPLLHFSLQFVLLYARRRRRPFTRKSPPPPIHTLTPLPPRAPSTKPPSPQPQITGPYSSSYPPYTPHYPLESPASPSKPTPLYPPANHPAR